MSEHTPGPWRVKANAAKILIEQTDDEGRWGLFVADCSMLDEGLANARLIAAAPDLLSAAQAALKWADDLKPYAEDGTTVVPAFEGLRAAIAKATLS